MADRDQLAGLMAQNTGGLSSQDFATFSRQLNDPTALQGWLDAGGIYGQYGGPPPDPDEQYFAPKPQVSGSPGEVSWMNSVQPWQQGGQAGGETTYQTQNSIMPGFIGAGGMQRADPAYWGWQGPHQGYASGSMGDLSGFNNNRGSGAGGTGGLSAQDFATFSRLVSPQALQEWLNAGGVQGQFGGGMGGAVGGGGGGGGGGAVGNANAGNTLGNANTGNAISNNTSQSVFDTGTTGFNNYGAPAGLGLAGGFGPAFGGLANSPLGSSHTSTGQATLGGVATGGYGAGATGLAGSGYGPDGLGMIGGLTGNSDAGNYGGVSFGGVL